jgi:hypothetical protein
VKRFLKLRDEYSARAATLEGAKHRNPASRLGRQHLKSGRDTWI